MIIQSQFRPAVGLSNAHLQTLLPLLLKSPGNENFIEQTLELEDGDFVDLMWTGKPENGRPIVIVFHGLEGSIDSHYATRIMPVLKQQGWTGLLMHFRGCSKRPNRLAHSYHSGETNDARYLIEWVTQTYPDSSLAAIGFSLGANMLLKLQAEYASHSPLKAAISICAPVRLDLCAQRLNQGLSRLYQHHLIGQLNQKLNSKVEQFDFERLIGLHKNEIKQIKTFWQFDDKVTAPLHGFKDVHDYYARCSARQYLKDIKATTLMIHALDDPFMTSGMMPDESELSNSVVLELSQHGGHIGFIGGRLSKPVFWLQQRIPEYLSNYLE